ncbi:homeobox protein NANOG isoform 2-T2 [Salvelinus alpinus]
MADWKVPVSFNPSYHAFAYGLVYQPGAEQNHPNFSSWTEATYNPGVSASYYSQAPPQHQSPSWSPEQNNAGTSNGQYPGSVVCLGDPHCHTQSGRLFISNNRAPHDPQTETERPSSDTQSDSETHTSPDSLSSSNDREEYNPQANHTTWVRSELETASGSPNSSENVSSSHPEEFKSLQVMGSEDCTLQSLPPSSPEKVDKNIPKQKARITFSTGQMDALTHRFNMQKYLTPAEMKTLAGLTGLTYKQVKTWFQNRRMKLKRHQKDDSWASLGYPNPGYPNMPQRPQVKQELGENHKQLLSANTAGISGRIPSTDPGPHHCSTVSRDHVKEAFSTEPALLCCWVSSAILSPPAPCKAPGHLAPAPSCDPP